MSRRLRICYLVAGHGLLATAGPSRNALSLARALSRHAEVEVAFRSLLDAAPPEGLRVVEIEPGALDPANARDDAATRGIGHGELLRYLAHLRQFVASRAGQCDVILEKSWLLSGWLSLVAERHGMLGVAVENVVPSARRHADAGVMKRLRVVVARRLAGHGLRRARLVIAETPALARDITRVWGVPAGRIAVAGLGVDRELFRPMPQAAARAALGVSQDRTVLVYVGLLDETHDLGPVVEAVATAARNGIELRIVGDGPARPALIARAQGSPRVVFCGRVPHGEVPRHIAIADLCLAPYDSRAFVGGSPGYSTMKIPEYLSVGRAVAASPSERARELIEDQVSGFLLPNDLASWHGLLAALPPRDRLGAMGEAALARPLPSWDDTARAYLAAIERTLAAGGRR